MFRTEPAHALEIRRLLLDASKRNGTVEPAPAWMGGVIAYGVHHQFATIHQWLDGQHLSAYKPMVNSLRAHGQVDEAAALLRRLVDCVERDPSVVAPWFSEQLASIYVQQSRFHEAMQVCESYKAAHPGPGAHSARLLSICDKLRERLQKAG